MASAGIVSPECPNCARPIRDGGICATCAAGLRRALLDVPGLVDDLLVTLAKQDRLATGGGRGGGESPLPVRLDIPDAIWALGNTVTTWTREVAETHGLRFDTGHLARPILGTERSSPQNRADFVNLSRCPVSDLPPEQCAHCRRAELPEGLAVDDHVTALDQPAVVLLGWRAPTALDSLRFAARWLADHIGPLCTLRDAPQAHDEITDAIAAANRACSAPPVRLFVGRCEACEHDLYGWPDHRAVACKCCGAQYRDMRERWEAALVELRGRVATAAFIARCVGSLYGMAINRKAINLWHHRGRVHPVAWVAEVDDPEPGAVRFLIGDVLDLHLSRPRRAGHPDQQ